MVQSNRYDALWRRREKIEYPADSPPVTNRYIYKDWLVLATRDEVGTLRETFTHGANLFEELNSLEGGTGAILASTQNNISQVYCYDFNWNIERILSEFWQAERKNLYSPFGLNLSKTDKGTGSVGFVSKETDFLLSLVYFGYRYYCVETGKWISRDLISEEKNENQYSFCLNNPINYIDYDGRDAFGNPVKKKGLIGKLKCGYKMRKWYDNCMKNVPQCDDCSIEDQALCFEQRREAVQRCATDSKSMLEACIKACYR